MEIDQDIPIGNSKPTNLGNVSKKPLPKKPILIGVGIIVIIAILALVVMFVLPLIDFNPLIIGDTNTDTPPVPVILTCEKRLNLNLSGVIAVFANGETKNSLISGKGTKSPFIQFYEGKNLIESIANPYKDINDAEEEIINLLKEKNTSNVALAGANEKFVKAFNDAELKCYSVGGEIAAYVGYDLPPEDTSFCKRLTNQDLMGKIAFGSDKNIPFSLVSGKGAQTTYLLIYQDKNYIGPINNTAKDSNFAEDDFITLLQNEGIDKIILSGFGDVLETKLIDTNLTCYEAGGEVGSFVK